MDLRTMSRTSLCLLLMTLAPEVQPCRITFDMAKVDVEEVQPHEVPLLSYGIISSTILCMLMNLCLHKLASFLLGTYFQVLPCHENKNNDNNYNVVIDLLQHHLSR